MATAKGGTTNRGAAGEGSEVDALFRLPLAEFTAARNALASRLKKAGDAELAGKVKALAKPSVSAWVVNQLYWEHREAFDRLLAAGERFRAAQAAQLSGEPADLRDPLEARRKALAELARLAAGVLRDAGHGVGPETMRRITTTLEALSTYGSLPDAPPAGRLTDDVDPPGFETLAALVPRVGGSGQAGEPPRIIPFQRQRRQTGRKKPADALDAAARAEEQRARVAAAQAAVREGERTVREVRETARKAEAELKKAAALAKKAEQARAEAEQRLEQATAAAEAARQHARRVAAEAEEAAQAVEEAERALGKARRELAEVSG